jgi:hypothetical protein
MLPVSIIRKIILFSFIFFFFPTFSQLSYNKTDVIHFKSTKDEYFSTIAYKLPFRGANFKFYGTLKYHIFGRAFAGKQVHNTLIEAFYQTKKNQPDVQFKILKTSGKKFGLIIPENKRNNGFYAVFMTPLNIGNRHMNYYYRTGIFRAFHMYDKDGFCNLNNKIVIDFESTAEHILNLDYAANWYGLRIKKVILSRFLLDNLYQTESGKLLKEREVYFPKFLSRKMNRKYDDLYYIEFEFAD